MFVSFESRFPYAFEEKCVSLTSVLTSAPTVSARPREAGRVKLTLQATEVRERRRLERLGSVNEVGEVKLGDVVADDEVRVDRLDKLAPAREQVGLLLELDDVRADDVGARVEREDVAHERLRLA